MQYSALQHSRTNQREVLLLLAGVVLSIALHSAFVIRGFGEPDTARLVIAAAEWHQTGQAIARSYIYRTSPLYIHGLKIILDLGVPLSKLPALLSWASVVLASLTLIPLYVLWRKLESRGAAAIGCVLLVFTPAYWLASSYGMAHLPSFSMFVLSLMVFALALGRTGIPYGIFMAGSTVLAVAAVGFKADMVLGFGAFFGVAICLKKVNWRTSLLSCGIPLLALVAVTGYTKLIAPSMSGVTGFAASWSDHFPFTLRALTEAHNRDVLINAAGRGFTVLAVLVAAYCVISRRHIRQLFLCMLWALPPILFWGLKMGNSARHMMSAVGALVFLVAIVLSARLPKLRWRVATVLLVVAMNYILGPSEGSSISPSPRLAGLTRQVQAYVENLHAGGRAFASLPIPAKMYVGSPALPYAIYEAISRAAAFEIQANDRSLQRIEFNPGKDWPVYRVTREDGSVQRIALWEVSPNSSLGPVDDWFLFSSEPDIMVANLMGLWRTYFRQALEANPRSASDWAQNEPLMIWAGLMLTRMGQSEEALKMFEGALVLNQNSADGLYNAGVIQLWAGRAAKARPLLTRFLRLYPNHKRAGAAADRLQQIESSGL